MAIGTAAAILGGAGIASSIGGSIIGGLASKSNKEKAADALQKAQDAIDAIGAPPDMAKPLIIRELQSAGVWKPEMEQHIDAGISKVSQIQEDPSLRQKQTATLQALQQIADTGMTATGRAEYNKFRSQAQQDAEAKRQQILQQMQMRGMGGSGAELAAQLSAAQGGANEQAAAADRIAAEQEQAKMAALGQLGGMAGQVRAQDFSNEATKAQAADAFKMFDVKNQLDQQARNIAAKNEAAKYDVMNHQRISDINTQAKNAEDVRELEGAAKTYGMKLQQAGLKAGAYGTSAQNYQQQAQNTAQGWSNIGSGIGGTLTTLAGKAMGKEAKPTGQKEDKNISQDELDEIDKKTFSPTGGMYS